jgi:predicted O-linked N-acetylglucosamine transferase (SPINDLY family)
MISFRESLEQAIALQQAGHIAEAQRHYEQLMMGVPSRGDESLEGILFQLLGGLYYEQKRMEEALSLFNRALSLDEQNLNLYFYRGALLTDMGRWAEGITDLSYVISQQADHRDAWAKLAEAAQKSKDWKTAQNALSKLVELEPDNPHWQHKQQEVAQSEQEDLNTWIERTKQDPDNPELLWEVARRLFLSGQYPRARTMLEHLLRLTPEHRQAHYYLGQCMVALGDTAEGKAQFQELYRQTGNDALLLMDLLSLPVIAESSDALRTQRQQLIEALNTLEGQTLQVQDPAIEIGMTPFFLVYQGQDDRALMEGFARILTQSLSYRAPAPHPPQRLIPRVAVVSSNILRPCTIQRLMQKLFSHVSPQQFEVVFFAIDQGDTPLAWLDEESASLPVVMLSSDDYRQACETILAQTPDVIIYPDIGMESLSYYLALQRLAPVQCVSWGHPVTTGMPEIDYYLSSQWLESAPDLAQTFYSENLILLEDHPMVYTPPALTGSPPTKEEFGYTPDQHLYICPQSLFKFHPDFDATLAEILLQDPAGRLLVIEGEYPSWTEKLMTRWTQTFGEAAQRVDFLPRRQHSGFIRLLAVADVMLDIPTFGGGNTSLDALSVGTPIVAQDGPMMRNRLTGGLLRRIQCTDTLVNTPTQYIAMATRVAGDPSFRQALSTRYRSQAAGLIETVSSVRQLEKALASMLAGEGGNTP